MARGDTQPPRRHFDDEQGDSAPAATSRYRAYPCVAHNCPMPGSIFLNGHDAAGVCAWHLGCDSKSLPQVTQIMRNWECLTDAINACRAFACDPKRATDPKAAAVALAAAWRTLSDLAPGWDSLKPQPGQHYADWGRQLEHFLTDRISQDVYGRQAERGQTRTVCDMASRVRDRSLHAKGIEL